jgi:hypothetical protein
VKLVLVSDDEEEEDEEEEENQDEAEEEKVKSGMRRKTKYGNVECGVINTSKTKHGITDTSMNCTSILYERLSGE